MNLKSPILEPLADDQMAAIEEARERFACSMHLGKFAEKAGIVSFLVGPNMRVAICAGEHGKRHTSVLTGVEGVAINCGWMRNQFVSPVTSVMSGARRYVQFAVRSPKKDSIWLCAAVPVQYRGDKHVAVTVWEMSAEGLSSVLDLADT